MYFLPLLTQTSYSTSKHYTKQTHSRRCKEERETVPVFEPFSPLICDALFFGNVKTVLKLNYRGCICTAKVYSPFDSRSEEYFARGDVIKLLNEQAMFIFKMSVDLFFYYYNYFKFMLMEFEKKNSLLVAS